MNMNHFRLRQTKSLKELNPDIESQILECRVKQMRQQYEQLNGTPQSNPIKMEAVEKQDNKTTTNGQPSTTKKYNGNGIWTKNNWIYVVEVPPPPPNEFEFLGLRPRKPPPTLANSSQYLKPPTSTKRKFVPKTTTISVKTTPAAMKRPLKRSYTDGNGLMKRRWSQENPLQHLRKMEPTSTKRKFVPKTTTTSVKTTPAAMKRPLKRSYTDGNGLKRRWSQENPLQYLLQMMEQSKSTPTTKSQKKTGTKSEEGRTMLLERIKQENEQMDDGENADKTINKDHEERMVTQMQQEEEDLPQILIEIVEQLPPPSSISPIQATSPLNQIPDPELAQLIEKKQNSMPQIPIEIVEQLPPPSSTSPIQATSYLNQIPDPESAKLIEKKQNPMPQIPVEIVEQLPPPPLSSTSPIQATSPLNQIPDPELAKLIEKKQNSMHIDEFGNLICHNGNLINNRFDVYKNIGEGVFAQVYLVKDHRDSNKYRALKIIRNTKEYRSAAQQEIDILEHFDRIDPGKKEQLVIRMLESFELPKFKNFCILFRAYGQDVYKFMEKNHYHPFPLRQIRYMAYQLIHATDFLHKNKLTHTDLKPENILFVNSTAYDNVKPWHRPEPPYDEGYKTPNKIKVLRDATICLIDMGSAVFDHQEKDSIVSTRHYRAPEILLKLGWNQSCDVWSLGCIFFELYTGHPLIPQIMDITHLAVLEKIFDESAVPNAMRRNTTTGYYKYYNNKLKLDIEQFKNDDKWKKEAPRVEEAKPLINYIYKKHKENPRQHEALFNLIARMLIYEPARRAKLADCQRDAFFDELEPELRAKVDRGGCSDNNERQDSKHHRGKNVKRAAPKAEDHHHYQKATEHRRHHHESGGSSQNKKRRYPHNGNEGEHNGWDRAGPSGGR